MESFEKLKPGFCCYGIVECKMCYKWKEDILIQNPKSVPSMADWRRCSDSLREITGPDFLINFGGGEALLKKDIFELVRYCKDKGFRTNIATNGYIIDEDMAKRIADSGLDSVNISLDSLDEKVHDYLRGVPGVFRNVMNAIEYLDKYCSNFEIEICSVIYDINQDGVIDLVKWANSDDRINWIVFMVPMQPNNTPLDGRWYEKEFSFLWPKDPDKVCSTIDGLLNMKKEGCKINNQICQLEAFKKYLRYPDSFVKKSKCNLDRAIHISSIGDIYICYRWALLGNIKRDDLADIWYSREAYKVRENIETCTDNCHFLLNCYFEGDYPFRLEPQNNIQNTTFINNVKK